MAKNYPKEYFDYLTRSRQNFKAVLGSLLIQLQRVKMIQRSYSCEVVYAKSLLERCLRCSHTFAPGLWTTSWLFGHLSYIILRNLLKIQGKDFYTMNQLHERVFLLFSHTIALEL